MLNDKDERFLADRQWRSRFGRPAMIVVAVLWAGAWLGFVLGVPLLANPVRVIEQLRADQLEPGTVLLLAAMCPVLFTLVGLLVLVFLLLAFSWTGMERRYLRLIQELRGR